MFPYRVYFDFKKCYYDLRLQSCHQSASHPHQKVGQNMAFICGTHLKEKLWSNVIIGRGGSSITEPDDVLCYEYHGVTTKSDVHVWHIKYV